jgi:hypothetical protein
VDRNHRHVILKFLGGVPQRVPEFAYSHRETVVKIDEGIGRPKALAKFFTGDDFPRVFEDHCQK